MHTHTHTIRAGAASEAGARVAVAHVLFDRVVDLANFTNEVTLSPPPRPALTEPHHEAGSAGGGREAVGIRTRDGQVVNTIDGRDDEVDIFDVPA
jgi:hypothetical protein